MTVNFTERRTVQPTRQETARQPLVTATPRGVETRRLSGVALYGIALALVGTVGMLYLLQTNYVASLGYEMTQLQQERESLTVENQQLRSELARRQSLSSAEQTASAELGLVPFEPRLYLPVERPEQSTESLENAQQQADERSVLDQFIDRLLGRGVVNSPGSAEEERNSQ